MTKNEMIDTVIKSNGFENEWTIWFCKLVEDNPDLDENALLNSMNRAITLGTTEEEEED